MQGFFFSNHQNMNKKATKQQRTNIALNRIGCAACPLNKAKVNTPKMKPTLAEDTWVYFLGMTPWVEEDKVGRPFVGKSGNLLRNCIPEELEDHCSFDNIQRDKGPDPTPTLTAIECCRSLVVKTIEQVKPRLIVGLGEPVLQWMLNTTDSKGLRGRIFTVKIGSHSCYFMPTYHPARVLRTAGEQAKRQGKDSFNLSIQDCLRSMAGRTFKFDLEKAFKFVETYKPPVIETRENIIKQIQIFDGSKDFDLLKSLLLQAKKAPVKAIDIETSSLRPYANNIIMRLPERTKPERTSARRSLPNHTALILSCAISFNSTTISFAIDHPKNKWTLEQRREILNILEELLINDTVKISHNSIFEIEWFISYFGREVVKHEVWECTQLQCSFIDERRGPGQSTDEDTKKATYQSLNFLAKMYFGVPFKDWFDVNRKNIIEADLNEMLLYGGADSFFTLPLWHHQRDILRAEGLLNACQMAMPRQPMLAITQHLGIDVNQVTVKRLQKKLEEEIAVLETEIDMLEAVQAYKKKHKTFNPMGDDAIVLFRDYLKRPEILVKDGDRTRISIDKHVLDKIDHPLAELIVKLRNKTKMKSTYVDGLELVKGELVYPDGKIHTNFNSTFTTTGRLSSDAPNFQNFPKRADNWIREQIIPPNGHMILAVDYGQLEMCGAAICSKDPYLVKMLWDDYDSHMFWAARLATICPDRVGGDFSDSNVAKTFRSLIKNKLVFPAIYGATNNSIAEYLGIELQYVDQLMDEFWDTFKGVKKWQNELLHNYRESGHVEAPTGRRRHHPLTTNEAINAPIQCLSSEIVVDAMCRLSYKASTENKWHLHPRWNIHDDIGYFLPIFNVEESIDIIIKEMLSCNEPWLNVPLSVEVSIGKNWADLESIGKYWSHK